MALIPYFEVNGTRYETPRNRFLMVEWEKMSESLSANEDAQSVIELQDKAQRLEALEKRKDELYDKYLESFSDEAKELYERAQAAYDALSSEVFPSIYKGGIITRVNKARIDNAEKLIILALQRDEKGEIIRKKEEAESIWCAYVNEAGQMLAQEHLEAFIRHITGEDEREDDNSFLAQAKARAEQQAENRKAGLAKIKK